jgi:hypothetical protein
MQLPLWLLPVLAASSERARPRMKGGAVSRERC